jgi:hypothetical protein
MNVATLRLRVNCSLTEVFNERSFSNFGLEEALRLAWLLVVHRSSFRVMMRRYTARRVASNCQVRFSHPTQVTPKDTPSNSNSFLQIATKAGPILGSLVFGGGMYMLYQRHCDRKEEREWRKRHGLPEVPKDVEFNAQTMPPELAAALLTLQAAYKQQEEAAGSSTIVATPQTETDSSSNAVAVAPADEKPASIDAANSTSVADKHTPVAVPEDIVSKLHVEPDAPVSQHTPADATAPPRMGREELATLAETMPTASSGRPDNMPTDVPSLVRQQEPALSAKIAEDLVPTERQQLQQQQATEQPAAAQTSTDAAQPADVSGAFAATHAASEQPQIGRDSESIVAGVVEEGVRTNQVEAQPAGNESVQTVQRTDGASEEQPTAGVSDVVSSGDADAAEQARKEALRGAYEGAYDEKNLAASAQPADEEPSRPVSTTTSSDVASATATTTDDLAQELDTMCRNDVGRCRQFAAVLLSRLNAAAKNTPENRDRMLKENVPSLPSAFTAPESAATDTATPSNGSTATTIPPIEQATAPAIAEEAPVSVASITTDDPVVVIRVTVSDAPQQQQE